MEALGRNKSLKYLDLADVGTLPTTTLGLIGKALSTNSVLERLLIDNNAINNDGMKEFYKNLFLEKKKKDDKEKGEEDAVASGLGKKREGRTPEQRAKERDEKRKELFADERRSMAGEEEENERYFRFNLAEISLKNNNMGYGDQSGKILGKIIHPKLLSSDEIHLHQEIRFIEQRLVRLNLENCGLTKEGGEALGLALEKNKSITLLDIKHNNIGKEGAKHLAMGLQSNTTLLTLDIR